MKHEPFSIDVECRGGRTIRVRAETNSWASVDLDVFYAPGKRRAVARLSRDNAQELLHALESVLDELERRRAEWIATSEGQEWLAHKADALAEEVGEAE